MNIHELKEEKQQKYNKLLNDCNVFWAFNNEQFEEGKAKNPLEDGDKYVQIFGGGIMPMSKVQALKDGGKAIEKWYREELKKEKNLRRDNIVYELGNHEAWYTHDIESTMDTLGPDYTAKEVWKVFYEEKEKQMELRG